LNFEQSQHVEFWNGLNLRIHCSGIKEKIYCYCKYSCFPLYTCRSWTSNTKWEK